MGRKFGFSFSWKRALGLSAAKGKLSRAIGIPLTKSGRQRKAGRLLGDLVGSALIAGTKSALKSESSTQRIRSNPIPAPAGPVHFQDYRLLIRAICPNDTVESVLQTVPDLTWVPGKPANLEELTDGRGLRVLIFRGRVSGIQISFVSKQTWEDLANQVSTHLSVPGNAVWSEDSPESGSWADGDRRISIGLENSIATVSVGLESITKEIIDSMGGLEEVKSLVAAQRGS
jgi:hypothetical protein